MHIIGRKVLTDAAKRYPVGRRLGAWEKVALKAKWRSLEEVRETYPSADGVRVARDQIRTGFNIGGNSFRLITEIDYERQTVLITHMLTHAEYAKDDWKK